tara:strand:- start:4961 stop:6850 length:1890 start_codon:yes stop_codon:yes gene_type:complete
MNFSILNNSSSTQRRAILAVVDFFLIGFSIYVVNDVFLEFSEESFISNSYLFIFITSFIGIILYAVTGQYKSLTRYATSKTAYDLSLRNFIFVILILLFSQLLDIKIVLSNKVIILWLLLICTTGGIRFVLRDFIYLLNNNYSKTSSSNAVIYGAGETGVELLTSLKHNNFKNVLCFIDDDKDLWGRSINGVPIKSPNSLINIKNISKTIYLAIPSLSKQRYKLIFSKISKLGFKILKVPSLSEIASGRSSLNEFRPLEIEDILGRDEVDSDEDLLKESINDKNILITGAGGSIGSEITKQIIQRNPRKIVLLDISEPSLHKISEELKEHSSKNIYIEFALGNASNEKLITRIIKKNQVNIIFHAAAYKHVPIVESNPIVGILNNVLSTKNLCDLSLKFNIEKFVLISSDKAVRPTSIMGASKRVCELIVQSRAFFVSKNINDMGSKNIKFSLVRFGNVLRSSGSVVPIFEKQIRKGGPLLVTHPDINRYFMTIEEAASLVIQSAALSKGGDIFLLDMGEPIKILDLAKKMINLSGYFIKDETKLDGDIEIKFTGLRKGEKLYEELLIEKNSEKTKHPLIFKSSEKVLDYALIDDQINQLIKYLFNFNKEEVFKILSKIVPEWNYAENY